MAYDPQANRRRPRPEDRDAAPVDALLGDSMPGDSIPSDSTPQDTSRSASPRDIDAEADPVAGSEPAPGMATEDPPPGPGVTPAPADPVPDSLVISTGMVAAAISFIVSLIALRWLWKRNCRLGSKSAAG